MIRKIIPKKVRKTIKNLFFKDKLFKDSATYWQERYKKGGNSGTGSYNILARFKAEVINLFIKDHQIHSVVEYGCGDGNQLKYYDFKNYLGYDVSRKSIKLCTKEFGHDKTKKFKLVDKYTDEKFDLGLSIDVIYHLIEDSVFNEYMKKLFNGSTKYIIIYSSDSDEVVVESSPHVKQREFSKWIKQNVKNYELMVHIPNKYPYNGDEINSSISDFFIYNKIA